MTPIQKEEILSRKEQLTVDRPGIARIFITPDNENCRSTLLKYMEQILFGLHEFLNNNVGITEQINLPELSRHFTDSKISEYPEKKLTEVITDIVHHIAPYAVNVASPYFIGHMTSAIPFFMVHLKTIVAALNQNVVKVETSKVASIVEKQVIAKLHRLVYNRDEAFYQEHVQSANTTLGVFTEGGTTANITALWAARNALFKPKDGFTGIGQEGVAAAYAAYGVRRCVVLVSRRGHYSLKKAGGLLGIGHDNVLALDVDEHHRIRIDVLKEKIAMIEAEGHTKILSIVGIAGTTETGTIDPLEALADICEAHDIHFHVDAAWGGPTLVSEKYGSLLKGIERADTVTIDAHKQFYLPMTCGMLYFKDPHLMDHVAYHANYVNRFGSVDLGIKSLAGSREANSLIMDSALKIMGAKGYAFLIEHGIETARKFAKEIERRALFQLLTPPELNILTYRICKAEWLERIDDQDESQKIMGHRKLNEINRAVQRRQREAGKSFVSRTVFVHREIKGEEIVVLRSVIMNPMTHMKILNEILDEQETIYGALMRERADLRFEPLGEKTRG